MIPLLLTLALAFLSLLSSGFVIIRIVVPILPPNPLSRRVPPVRPHHLDIKYLLTSDLRTSPSSVYQTTVL